MKFLQKWTGIGNGLEFPASVPGNIQKDYLEAIGYGDIQVGDNVKIFQQMEDWCWEYRTVLNYTAQEKDSVWFVSLGIDYACDILLNGEKLTSHEGMFTTIEVCLDGKLRGNDLLQVMIHPHPKRPGAKPGKRQEADHSAKPPVGYGWDFHPRALVSGMWQEAYIETRNAETILSCEPFYILSDDLTQAEVTFDVQCEAEPEITLFDGDGHAVGQGKHMLLKDIRLWWCSGHGEPYLYRWVAKSASDEKSGYIGFKRARLVMGGDTWHREKYFPMTRAMPPITVELNGKNIFVKGSNLVGLDIFTGCVNEDRYEALIRLAKDAHFNLLRCWGGSGIQKKAFYDLCDRYGIMIWAEFPLACNNYPDDPHYLAVLEQEARSIVARLRSHACHVLWCGGNELFCSWSHMTDQSKAIRLLNKVCYELDGDKAFLPASPVMGMKHGPYRFVYYGKECFELFQNNDGTAYTEFGVPAFAEEDCIRSIIPPDEIDRMEPGTAWETHHAVHALNEDDWNCIDIIQHYFGDRLTLGQLIDDSQLLQEQGYKAIFEEARRQSPNCAMAINWCLNEPWNTASNNSIIRYPDVPKRAYQGIAVSLKSAVASAKVKKFSWQEGETFQAELWMLNDNGAPVEDEIDVVLKADGKEYHLAKWATGVVTENTQGITVGFPLPPMNDNQFQLILRSASGCDNNYVFCRKQR